MKARFLLSLLAVVFVNSLAFAEKAPLSVEELKRHADVIVVATIDHIRVKSEPSSFESAFGNSDWGIYLTLRLKSIEKGNVSNDQLEVRCFRIRSRRSHIEYLTPSGHHPIPATGTRVRVYLEKADSSWHVVLPNGIFPIDNNAQDALEVTQLRSRAYTYFLPLEIWMLLIILGIACVIFFKSVGHRKRQRVQPNPQVTEQSHGPEPFDGLD